MRTSRLESKTFRLYKMMRCFQKDHSSVNVGTEKSENSPRLQYLRAFQMKLYYRALVCLDEKLSGAEALTF